MEKRKEIKINFENGISSIIDEHVYELILDLQKKIDSPKKLPLFWNLSKSIKNLDDDFLKFYSYLLSNYTKSRSQIFQDLFVLYKLNEKKNGVFLEFGATDGVNLSNSLLLEKHYQWSGLLAEPSTKWHSSLK